MKTISAQDELFYRMAREHISAFRNKWGVLAAGKRVLEIGPEHDVWPGAETLGLNEKCKYVADITTKSTIPDSTFDFIFCNEVIEHTVLPESAIEEIRRIAKHDALCVFSAPWGFRLHNPLPDCWRISVHGWRVLLRNFEILQIDVLDDPDRFLMPIHYNILARVIKDGRSINPRLIKFEAIPNE